MKWWRFDRYEARNGYVRPHRDAKLIPYEPSNGSAPARDATYQSVVRLVGRLIDSKQFSPEGDDVTQEGAKTVIEWCSHHGLLGVLPHQLLSVVLEPRWAHDARNGRWCISQVQYNRAADAPAAFRETVHTYGVSNTRRSARDGGPVSKAQRARGTKEAGALLYHPWSQSWTYESLKDCWAAFFPGIDGRVEQYPCPLTDDFWRLYAEPIHLFLEAASWLWEAVISLTGKKPNEMSTRSALRVLRALVHPTGMILDYPEPYRAFSRVWASPSLMGWFGLCIAEDLALRAVARRCRECGTPFLSGAYQARYCSERCRGKLNMRNFRRRSRRPKVHRRKRRPARR